MYKNYFKAAGSWAAVIPLAVVAVGTQALLFASDWTLKSWVNEDTNPATRSTGLGTAGTVYAILAFLMVPTACLRAFLWLWRALVAARTLHDAMLSSVLRAPIAWFDSKPIGQIINRFSADITLLDESMPQLLTEFMQTALLVLGVIVLVCVVNPWVLIALAPMLVVFHWVRVHYVKSSQQVKRIESITRSPIHSLMSATVDGLLTIRGTPGLAPLFHKRFLEATRTNSRAFNVWVIIIRWFGTRLDLFSAVFIAVTSFLAIASIDSVDSSAMGLALSYCFQLLGLFQWSIR